MQLNLLNKIGWGGVQNKQLVTEKQKKQLERSAIKKVHSY